MTDEFTGLAKVITRLTETVESVLGLVKQQTLLLERAEAQAHSQDQRIASLEAERVTPEQIEALKQRMQRDLNAASQ